MVNAKNVNYYNFFANSSIGWGSILISDFDVNLSPKFSLEKFNTLLEHQKWNMRWETRNQFFKY